MKIIKLAIIGAAVAFGVNYIMQKRSDGSTFLDELSDNAPDWMEKAKDFAANAIDKVAANIRS